tara:strand:- start:3905 stop:4723 length:819 start_codon:yes stop_codon:yes gene_type:complete
MPAANMRAMDKARDLQCDAVIFDLEDAVAVASKEQARRNVAQQIAAGGYGQRELIIRVNGPDTPWGSEDLRACAQLPIDALLFPKVSSRAYVEEIDALVQEHNPDLPIWIMIETPTALIDMEHFAGHPRVQVLVMGTSDLVQELRATHTPDRHNLAYALQRSVAVARHFGKEILDGVHLDFRNTESFLAVCEHGKALGFDGKTLIHPDQIATANSVFGYSVSEEAHARAVISAWRQAEAQGRGVAELDGQLIENLHVAAAERVIAYAKAQRG